MKKINLAVALITALVMGNVMADDDGNNKKGCPVSHSALKDALSAAQAASNGGFGLNMWGTVVNRDGIVCAVAFTGGNRGDQWPGSRVISAQKANTANAFSLPLTAPIPGLALSTANLWAATQPGGSLFGLQFSNPVDPSVAYGAPGPGGNANRYGMRNDPLNGKFVGGVNVFGGGLALYDSNQTLLGAVGVSGDSSCADHNIAWRTRDQLGLDYVPNGVGAIFGNTVADNIIFDLAAAPAGVNPAVSPSGFGHPECTGEMGENKALNDIIVDVNNCPPGNGVSPNCV